MCTIPTERELASAQSLLSTEATVAVVLDACNHLEFPQSCIKGSLYLRLVHGNELLNYLTSAVKSRQATIPRDGTFLLLVRSYYIAGEIAQNPATRCHD